MEKVSAEKIVANKASIMAIQKGLKKAILKELNFFYWINEGDQELMLIGGMGVPYLKGDSKLLKALNVGLVINLTGHETPCSAEYKSLGIEEYFIVVEDLMPPTIDQIDEFIKKTDEYMIQGKNVVVHCHAGLGRTGTMIACWLVAKKDYLPEGAITKVREQRPGSVETRQQENIIKEFYRKVLPVVTGKK